MQPKQLKRRVLEWKRYRDSIVLQTEMTEASLNKALSQEKQAAIATQIVLDLSHTIQQQLVNRVSKVVTSCLRDVFGPQYSFEIVLNERGEAVLSFVIEDNVLPGVSAVGGGVVDVAAFTLRLVCGILGEGPDQTGRLFIFDEPFRFVSKRYRAMVSALLTSLCSEFGVRFLLVTHDCELLDGDSTQTLEV